MEFFFSISNFVRSSNHVKSIVISSFKKKKSMLESGNYDAAFW